MASTVFDELNQMVALPTANSQIEKLSGTQGFRRLL